MANILKQGQLALIRQCLTTSLIGKGLKLPIDGEKVPNQTQLGGALCRQGLVHLR
jgi:hypothetical protein